MPATRLRSLFSHCVPSSVAMCRLADRHQVLFTFDDGPDPALTPRVLDALEQHGARGLFFVPGLRVARAPHLLREIVARGHALGNHSYSHRRLPSLAWRDLIADIEDGRRAIFDACGVQVRFLRPPYGVMSARVVAAAWATGHRLMLWSADTLEYGRLHGAHAPTLATALLDQSLPGAIVLSHDDHAAIPAVLQQVLPRLRQTALDMAGPVATLPWHIGVLPPFDPPRDRLIRHRATA